MKNKILSIITLVLTSVLLVSCSGYNRVVKGDDYEQKLIIAEQLFEKKSYSRALTLYEQVYERFPRTEDGQTSYYKMGMSYYKMRDFITAGYYLSNFVTRFPFSPKAEECLFLNAICSVRLSPEASLDQGDTDMAINDLQLFIDRFPESSYVDSCNSIMDDLRFKLETKDYKSVKLYANMSNYKAAKMSASAFIENYPQSTYNEELEFVRLENAYILATKSIFSKKKERFNEVELLCDQFRQRYPESKYLKKVNRVSENTEKDLLKVSETYLYQDVLASFQKSRTKSNAKKIIYLKETIEKHRNFVAEFPNSDYLKRLNDIKNKSERELQKIQ